MAKSSQEEINKLYEEQKQIVEEVKDKRKASYCIIIKSYIKKYLPSSKTIEGPKVSIEGIRPKLDLVITNTLENQKDIQSFKIKDVHAVVKISKIGWLFKKPNQVIKIRELFNEIVKKNPDIICCCLSISDRKPKNSTKKDYQKDTQKILSTRYRYFVLSNHPNYEPHTEFKNNWQNFLRKLKLNIGVNSKI